MRTFLAIVFFVLFSVNSLAAGITVVQKKAYAPSAVGSSIPFSLTSTPTPGNIIIACTSYSQYTQSRTISSPSGTWTQVDNQTNSNDSMAIWWHEVVSGDTTNYTFTISGGTEWQSGIIYEFSGVGTANPINQHGMTNSTSSNPITTPSETPSVLSTFPLACADTDAAGAQNQTLNSNSSGWSADVTASPSSGYHGTWSSTHAVTIDTTTAMSNAFNFSVNTNAVAGIVLLSPGIVAPAVIARLGRARFNKAMIGHK